MESIATASHREPWNKGKIVGQKAPFKLKDSWTLRVRLQMANRVTQSACGPLRFLANQVSPWGRVP